MTGSLSRDTGLPPNRDSSKRSADAPSAGQVNRIAGLQKPDLTLKGCPALGPEAPRVLIYTDGGCRPNPGPGGWAAILWTSGWELELGGGGPDTTNNRMEMTAALAGLDALTCPARVTIVTDSEYLHKGMTSWITKWSANGFKKKKGELLNPDIWRSLAVAALEHETSWAWTRGHSGVALNERCDSLATEMLDCEHKSERSPSHQARSERPPFLPEIVASKTADIWLPA